MAWKAKRTNHVERTVRKIGHVQDAVHQRQTQRHQSIDTAQCQAIEHLLQENVHHALPLYERLCMAAKHAPWLFGIPVSSSVDAWQFFTAAQPD